MFGKISDMLTHIVNNAESMMPGIKAAYDKHTASIWTEGGEWVRMRSNETKLIMGVDTKRITEAEYVNPGRIDKLAKRVVADMMDSQTKVIAYTLECGTGKSTLLPLNLLQMKVARKIISVQPSTTVAEQLALYMQTNYGDYAISMVQNETLSMGLNYVGAGTFLKMFATNKIHVEDYILLDEAHTPSFVHGILNDMLNKTKHQVVLLTASTTSYVKSNDKVTCIAVSERSKQVNDALQSSSRGIEVGVGSDGQYLVPAAPLVGVTMDLTVIYDTGLRPAPSVEEGSLVLGERQAQTIELVQMAGRLGRLGKAGKYFYVEKPAVYIEKGVSLYDVLDSAYRSMIGLSTEFTAEQCDYVMAHHGIIGKTFSPTVIADKTVGIDAPCDQKIDAKTYREADECDSTVLDMEHLDNLLAKLSYEGHSKKVILTIGKAYALLGNDCISLMQYDYSADRLLAWFEADKLRSLVATMTYPDRTNACYNALLRFNDTSIQYAAIAHAANNVKTISGTGTRHRLCNMLRERAHVLTANLQSIKCVAELLLDCDYDVSEHDLDMHRIEAASQQILSLRQDNDAVVPYSDMQPIIMANMRGGSHYSLNSGAKPAIEWEHGERPRRRRKRMSSISESSSSSVTTVSSNRYYQCSLEFRKTNKGNLEVVRRKK